MFLAWLVALAFVPSLTQPPLAPPPIIRLPAQEPPSDIRGVYLLDFRPLDVRCADRREKPVSVEAILPAATLLLSEDAADLARLSRPLDLHFRIDMSGRPLGIAPADTVDDRYRTSDAASSLAAWRFRPGRARERCALRFEVTATTLEKAPERKVWLAYGALGEIGQDWRKGAINDLILVHLSQPDASCLHGVPDQRDEPAAFPDTLLASPGSIASSVVGFDISAAGEPINIRPLLSGENAELDRLMMQKAAASRYASGASGCIVGYVYSAMPAMPAPPRPSAPTLLPQGSGCASASGSWISLPEIDFPENFRIRNILGWAIVAYDVEPDGRVTHARALAAEPAASFGWQAQRVVAGGRKPPPGRPLRGCIVPVRFDMIAGQEEGSTVRYKGLSVPSARPSP